MAGLISTQAPSLKVMICADQLLRGRWFFFDHQLNERDSAMSFTSFVRMTTSRPHRCISHSTNSIC